KYKNWLTGIMIKIASTILAISVDDILSGGQKVGTASNQVILGALVVILIIVVLYRERQQNRTNKSIEHRNEALIDTIERDRRSWDDERRERSNALMQLVKDNTTALEKSASAEMAIKDAVEANTRATDTLVRT